MRRNYYRKLSARIYHHAKNVGIIGILAFLKTKSLIQEKSFEITFSNFYGN